MYHFEWSWTQEGLKIYAQGWKPTTEAKGVVCIIHGFNDDSGRFKEAAEDFCHAGYAVLSYDQFGNGKTDGKRGHVPSYDALLDSVKIILDEATARFPGLKVFLWGHSMGGAIAVNYALRRNPVIAGVIATGPFFKLAFEPPAFKVWLAGMMKNIYPKYTDSAQVDSTALSRNPEVVKQYNKSPYNHNKITAATFFGLLEAGKWAIAHAGELKLPILLMHGTADKIISVEGTKEFAANAPKNLVTLKLWDGFYHELHNEPEPDRTEAINFMINWINSRA